MNSLTDQHLLRDYAEHRSEAPFAELVRRHVDLVHSAALRMVCDEHLAKDVTQGVFVALARNAGQLVDRPVLAGWLHRTAQNIAAQTVRTDVRRRAREQEAAAMNELLSAEPETDWEHIAPHLDTALGELGEADRDALLLRYFERKSAREMAQTLGISNEAAQKRVNRAVERLREFFAKRGVTVGAGGLAIVISANAVQAAPAGLAVTISAAALAGTTIATTATATFTKTIAMTTLQKTLLTSVVTVALGAGIYEARKSSTLQTHFQNLQQQQAERIFQLQKERDDASNRLAAVIAENAQFKSNRNAAELLKLRGEVTRLRKAGSESSTAQTDPGEALTKSWLAREAKLKELVKQHPDKAIPEFQLLSEHQWLDAASGATFDSDIDIRQNLANLRHAAENNFAGMARDAFSKYMAATAGQNPTELSQLQPYFTSPVDDAILSRWTIVPQSEVPQLQMGSDWLITEKAPVDAEFDNRMGIGLSGYGYTPYATPEISAAIATINPAFQAYAAANNGKQPSDPSQIEPYLTTPEQQAAFQTLTKNQKFPVSSSR